MILRTNNSTGFVFKLKCALFCFRTLLYIVIESETNKARASSNELDQAVWKLKLTSASLCNTRPILSFIEQNNEPQANFKNRENKKEN